MQYTTTSVVRYRLARLCYQDFKDTFVCNTQHDNRYRLCLTSCVIRISKILLYAIHNLLGVIISFVFVVLSGFQRYFCMQYTTSPSDQYRCSGCVIRISKILLYAIHNSMIIAPPNTPLCYQDFKDTFVCNTQPSILSCFSSPRCVIRISKILLYAIHNTSHITN